MNHTEQRLDRIKMAQAILNIYEIDKELNKYDFHSLRKQASVGLNSDRVKFAALLIRRDMEKQAVIGGLLRGGMALGKGLLGGTGRAIANTGKGIAGLAGGVGKGLKDAGKVYGQAKSVGEGFGGQMRQIMNAKNTAANMNRLGAGMFMDPKTRSGARFAGNLMQTTPGKIRSDAVKQMGNLVGDMSRAGWRGAGQGITNFTKNNPMQALMGAGALGGGAVAAGPGGYLEQLSNWLGKTTAPNWPQPTQPEDPEADLRAVQSMFQ